MKCDRCGCGEDILSAVRRIVGSPPHAGCVCADCCDAAMTVGPRPESAIWRCWEGRDGVLGWDDEHIVTVEDDRYVLYRRSDDGLDLGELLCTVDAEAVIQDAYEDASGSWTTADWTHERRRDDGSIVGVEMCEGGDPERCAICRQAAEDAAEAERLAEEAMEALQRGDYRAAADLAAQVRRLEEQYGDAPTWGRWARMVEEYAEPLPLRVLARRRT